MGKGLGFYWPGSVKNLEDDLVAHERAAAEVNTTQLLDKNICCYFFTYFK
jgi:hypothetical protein